MKGISRRDILKLSGAGLTGIALSGLSTPGITLRKAYGFASDTAAESAKQHKAQRLAWTGPRFRRLRIPGMKHIACAAL
jgi:hypothetical protein